MGYIRHHAILCTSWDSEIIDKARGEVIRLLKKHRFDSTLISEVAISPSNAFYTFVIFPDGSKEGWEESDAGNRLRDEVINHLNGFRYDDGSSPIAWAEVQYGDDDHDNKVTRNSDEEGVIDNV